MTKTKNTSELILDSAQAIVQEFGFNGFSYAHIAEKIGIRTASIHYYFQNKEDLGEALIARYLKNFLYASATNDSETQNNLDKLHKFVLLYNAPVQDYCTCLSVMLSSELATLSEKVREGLAQFFNANLTWLEQVFENGRREGHLYFKGEAEVQAHQLIFIYVRFYLLVDS
ncbi:TetR/AcrR family transcriptional regulator [Paenibacillus aceris]|uniref:TetR/AcrR family transcriptional repressor of nem operon n=1 Tax=Paenibacillus aceris TaxID=869555 RepID=A0ABS4HZK5_9BACL|nr:TetR/AcrR family transcriptional regulator [Paenibacillus aceris]MBP1964111.1 TetR/AcrR family transcriptional repressor of nem operon [Paenibacillus aceris]NHW36445.1 TetR/AcrR family transcriptional regulator [Paenibacillus aceris]